jgi:hypothetical protein
VFGEIAFLLGIDRTADVIAVGDTKSSRCAVRNS